MLENSVRLLFFGPQKLMQISTISESPTVPYIFSYDSSLENIIT